MSEAEPLFFATLAEMGQSLPSDELAIRAYVRLLAQEIVEGKVSPREQVSRIHAEILSPLKHPRDLMVWCYVGDGMQPRGGWNLDPGAMVYWDEVPEPELDRTIAELAKWYLEQTGRTTTD